MKICPYFRHQRSPHIHWCTQEENLMCGVSKEAAGQCPRRRIPATFSFYRVAICSIEHEMLDVEDSTKLEVRISEKAAVCTALRDHELIIQSTDYSWLDCLAIDTIRKDFSRFAREVRDRQPQHVAPEAPDRGPAPEEERAEHPDVRDKLNRSFVHSSVFSHMREILTDTPVGKDFSRFDLPSLPYNTQLHRMAGYGLFERRKAKGQTLYFRLTKLGTDIREYLIASTRVVRAPMVDVSSVLENARKNVERARRWQGW